MKRLFYLVAALGAVACSAPKMEVEVKNPTDQDREHETVEIAWSDVEAAGLEAGALVVYADGEEIPSQVIYNGEEAPQSLIFQCNVEGLESKTYIIKQGKPAPYAIKCQGRHVPERLDDYAWENDKIAFRAYGPALETAPGEMLVSPGFDCWVKCVDTLVVDARYKRGNYHHNYGDGMDCYKVGRTLGAGASAPYVEDQLWMSHNWMAYRTLDNGPLRTAVELTYAPFLVGEKKVALQKTITLDANTHFNRIENTYSGDFETLPVAAGFIRHDVKGLSSTEHWLGFCEAASDSKHPEEDGDLYFGVILPGAEFRAEAAGHAVAIAQVENSVPMVYYAGAGWSLGGIEEMTEWMEILDEATASIIDPLVVTIL